MIIGLEGGYMGEDGYVNNMQICLLDGGSADYEYKN